ncbi:glycoside hydrolase family 127 protein [Flavitalea flava]
MLAGNVRKLWMSLTVFSCTADGIIAQHTDYPIQPVAFTRVHLTDNFWEPKIEVNADVTIPYVLQKCRENGRIDNFLRASKKLKDDKMTDFPFDDTDLYKLIEGASYGLQVRKNPKLEKQLDTLIGIIAAAQEPDGYLYTFRTMQAAKPHEWIGAKRWEKEEILSHELYNAGHLYESAVAHYQATGKRTLLNVAIKNADLLVKDFGYGKVEEYPGHQIVEIGLAKLYRVTGEKKYLDLAKFFLDIRGPKGGAKGDSYNQADKKVVDQHEAEGHAVRAAYMYTGMADVAALTGDKNYLKAIDDIWGDVVMKKLYITGGIGATGNGEAFGDAYDLPNMSAYAETCAAIANVYWNSRMFLLHGDSKYIDVLERTLYNGLLSGVSLSGDRFFYPNPLASMGQHQRSGWFACACCISNVARFLPSVPGYVYAQKDNDLFVNLYVSNKMEVDLSSTKVTLTETTDYPWAGKVSIGVDPEKSGAFALRLRLPGWAQGQPVPGDLYHFSDTRVAAIPVLVNGKPVDYLTEHGYAVLQRTWKKGDKVVIEFPMPVQRVMANTSVKADRDRFAFQRGPVVYCLEGADHQDSSVNSIVVDTLAAIQVAYNPAKLKGITELSTTGTATSRQLNSDDLVSSKEPVKAIPYYSWNNRGPGEMEVWIPYEASAAHPRPAATIASKSRVSSSAAGKLMVKALNDQYDPVDSKDNSAPYLHWWPKKNTVEFVEYDFDSSYSISESRVYWFDDGPWGGCRIPLSWKLFYRKDGQWFPVEPTGTYEVVKDRYNSVKFTAITTNALKMEVQLPAENSSGIHEWIVK